MNPTATFIGFQFGFRLYNVEGDHPLKHSSVSVKTLIDNHIPINDMSMNEIKIEVERMDAFIKGAHS